VGIMHAKFPGSNFTGLGGGGDGRSLDVLPDPYAKFLYSSLRFAQFRMNNNYYYCQLFSFKVVFWERKVACNFVYFFVVQKNIRIHHLEMS